MILLLLKIVCDYMFRAHLLHIPLFSVKGSEHELMQVEPFKVKGHMAIHYCFFFKLFDTGKLVTLL